MKRYFPILFVAFIGLIVVSSCKKTKPCEVVVTVTDSTGKAIAGAKVVLRQDSVINPETGVRANIFDEETTAGNGEAIFSFSWEAVLNVEVTYLTQSAKDYVRLEQSETVRKTVVLK